MAKRDYYEDHEELLKMLNARDARVAELDAEVARLREAGKALLLALDEANDDIERCLMAHAEVEFDIKDVLVEQKPARDKWAAALAAKEV